MILYNLLSKMRCFFFGHDDIFKIEHKHMYLQCMSCLRKTNGWTDLHEEKGLGMCEHNRQPIACDGCEAFTQAGLDLMEKIRDICNKHGMNSYDIVLLLTDLLASTFAALVVPESFSKSTMGLVEYLTKHIITAFDVKQRKGQPQQIGDTLVKVDITIEEFQRMMGDKPIGQA